MLLYQLLKKKMCSKFWKLSSKILLGFVFFYSDKWHSSSRVSSAVTQSCPILFDLMDCVACQAPFSMSFSRQEYWSELPFSPSGYLPNPGIEPRPRIKSIAPVSPALAGRFFTLSHLGSPYKVYTCAYIKSSSLCVGFHIHRPRRFIVLSHFT